MNFNFTPDVWSYIQAFWIIAGIWVTSKLFWMCVYQIKYGGDYGERYMQGLITKEEKEDLKNGRFYGRK